MTRYLCLAMSVILLVGQTFGSVQVHEQYAYAGVRTEIVLQGPFSPYTFDSDQLTLQSLVPGVFNGNLTVSSAGPNSSASANLAYTSVLFATGLSYSTSRLISTVSIGEQATGDTTFSAGLIWTSDVAMAVDYTIARDDTYDGSSGQNFLSSFSNVTLYRYMNPGVSEDIEIVSQRYIPDRTSESLEAVLPAGKYGIHVNDFYLAGSRTDMTVQASSSFGFTMNPVPSVGSLGVLMLGTSCILRRRRA